MALYEYLSFPSAPILGDTYYMHPRYRLLREIKKRFPIPDRLYLHASQFSLLVRSPIPQHDNVAVVCLTDVSIQRDTIRPEFDSRLVRPCRRSSSMSATAQVYHLTSTPRREESGSMTLKFEVRRLFRQKTVVHKSKTWCNSCAANGTGHRGRRRRYLDDYTEFISPCGGAPELCARSGCMPGRCRPDQRFCGCLREEQRRISRFTVESPRRVRCRLF